jgi:tetratricopeptide (TPR) repeat protein
MGVVYYRLHQYEKAAACFRELIQSKGDLYEIRNKLAWILATNEKLRTKYAEEARQLASDLCRDLDYKNPIAMDTLAVAFAALGKFDNAIAMGQTAMELVKNQNNPELLKTITRHLECFHRNEAINSTGQQLPNLHGFTFRMEPIQ